MKTIAIEGTLRDSLGGRNAKQLRRDGLVPCVVYGGEENIHFYTPEVSFKTLLYTPEVYHVEINIDGKTHSTIIRDVQYHPVSDDVEHVDFLELVPDKVVTLQVPVVLTGNSRGVRNGGRLKTNLRKLRVKSLPKSLPGHIEIDITNLRIGETVRVQDITTEGYEIDHEPTRAICLIQTARNVIEELPEDEEDEAAEGAEEVVEAQAEESAETES